MAVYPIQLQAAIREQLQIGRKGFLEGLVSNKWTEYMNQYYQENNSRRNGQTWTQKLIRNNWYSIHFLWKERCSHLHDTNHILDRQGIKHVQDSITKELNIGIFIFVS